MSSRTRRNVAGAIVVVGAVAALVLPVMISERTESTYFETDGSTEVGVPAAFGESVFFGVLLAAAHDGDLVRFEGLEAVDPFGDVRVEALVAVLPAPTTWIGAGTEADLRAAGIDLCDYESLAGTELAQADGQAALAVRLTGGRERFGFESVRLSFRVNGGPILRQTIAISATVCPVAAGSTDSGCAPP